MSGNYQYRKALQIANAEEGDDWENNCLGYLRQAVELGHPMAHYALGTWYLHGVAVRKNYKKAVKLLQKAAQSGITNAKYDLAICYEKGEGIEKSEKKAFKLFLSAAQDGDLDAIVETSRRFYYGIGTRKDYSASIKWDRKAAKKGDVESQLLMARAYRFGDGVKRNSKWAVYWYKRAAANGSKEAVQYLKTSENANIIQKLMGKDDYVGARKILQKELKKNPNDTFFLGELSNTYYEQFKYKKAFEIIKKAIKLNPDEPLVMWHYAGSLASLDRSEEAIKVFKRIIRKGVEKIAYIDTWEGPIWAKSLIIDCIFRIGCCYKEMGKNKLAIQWVKKCLNSREKGLRCIYSVKEAKAELYKIEKG